MADLDTETVSDTGTISEPESIPDNGATEAATAANPATDPSAGPSAGSESAGADNQTDDGAQSLTDGAETKAESQPAANWENQYKKVQGWATQVHQKNLELEKRLAQLEGNLKQREQEAQQKKTEPWDEGDPRHNEFLRLVDRAEYFDELIRGEQNPELVKALQQKQLAMLGDEGVSLLQRWQNDVRQQERERRLNPRAFYTKLIRQEAQPVVRETLQTKAQEYQSTVEGRQAATKWAQSLPEGGRREQVAQALKLMESGMPFELASAIAERDYFRKQVSGASKDKASAEEKERLLQGKAAGVISRNPNASKKVDVGQLRKDKGVRNSREFADLLFELDQQGLLE